MAISQGRQVTVLWAGGWDIYLVNPEELRELTLKERYPIGNEKYWPTHDGRWLLCRFLTGKDSIGTSNQAVRILRRVRSGD
jgi:hypothetical protein